MACRPSSHTFNIHNQLYSIVKPMGLKFKLTSQQCCFHGRIEFDELIRML